MRTADEETGEEKQEICDEQTDGRQQESEANRADGDHGDQTTNRELRAVYAHTRYYNPAIQLEYVQCSDADRETSSVSD